MKGTGAAAIGLSEARRAGTLRSQSSKQGHIAHACSLFAIVEK
jgi:hypothetical protein